MNIRTAVDRPRLNRAHHGRLGHIRDDAGQATAEYALLTGAVAVILVLVTAWATGTGKVGALLDAVFDNLIGSV